MTSEYLAKQLSNEVDLMTQLVSELPAGFRADTISAGDLRHTQQTPLASKLPASLPADTIPAGDLRHTQLTPLASELPASFAANTIPVGDLRHIQLDVDYRALYTVLKQVDPSDHWGGLSRTYTPEGEVLWLCRDHAQQYSV
jgi:hypothetical protein